MTAMLTSEGRRRVPHAATITTGSTGAVSGSSMSCGTTAAWRSAVTAPTSAAAAITA
jgi:hypothetical protein